MSAIGQTVLAMADATRAIEWRKEDLGLREVEEKQRVFNNRNRAVDVKCSQLRTISELSALIAGFTMVVLVELTIPDDCPPALVIAFGTLTALVITMMVRVMVGCSLLLVGILRRSSDFFDRKAFLHFWLNRCEEKWKRLFKTFSFGIPFFLCDLIIVAWIKFTQGQGHTPAAIVVTVVCFVGVVIWLFDHCSWGKYLISSRREDSRQLDIESMQYVPTA